MNEKDGFKIKVESSKNRAFGSDTGIDTKDEQSVSDALLDAVEHQRQVNEKQHTINEMLIDSVENLIVAEIDSNTIKHYEQGVADADENRISIKDINKEIAKDYKYEHDQISEMVLPDEIIVESVVNVKDTNYTRYYDKELGIWFCKFCEQQIVGDQNGI